MKLEIKQATLIEHLNYVIKGISSKNIIPVLNCIKFELNDEGLYLTSTDNEIAIKTFIKADDIENIEKCGKIVVSGRYIYDIIKKIQASLPPDHYRVLYMFYGIGFDKAYSIKEISAILNMPCKNVYSIINNQINCIINAFINSVDEKLIL